jgi:hypothetical protein
MDYQYLFRPCRGTLVCSFSSGVYSKRNSAASFFHFRHFHVLFYYFRSNTEESLHLDQILVFVNSKPWNESISHLVEFNGSTSNIGNP